MTDTKHTPGPWTAQRERESGQEGRIMDANKLIRSTATHDYYAGPLGEISVPKLTRQCTVCKKRDVLNMDSVSFHKQHGGTLEKVVD